MQGKRGLKAGLRASLRRHRKALHAAHPGAPHDLIETFQASCLPLPAVAAVYRAAGSEIDPQPLADWLLDRGVRITLPVVAHRDAPLLFREALDGPLARDALGLPVPQLHAATLRPDLIFLPLLGFDRAGARLGQGGGYFDRTLAALRADGTPVRAIGVAYAGQEVAHIPTDPFDQCMDGVLTETDYLDFRGGC